MGSPIRPIVANLFMADPEVQAIKTSPSPPEARQEQLPGTPELHQP